MVKGLADFIDMKHQTCFRVEMSRFLREKASLHLLGALSQVCHISTSEVWKLLKMLKISPVIQHS